MTFDFSTEEQALPNEERFISIFKEKITVCLLIEFHQTPNDTLHCMSRTA